MQIQKLKPFITLFHDSFSFFIVQYYFLIPFDVYLYMIFQNKELICKAVIQIRLNILRRVNCTDTKRTVPQHETQVPPPAS